MMKSLLTALFCYAIIFSIIAQPVVSDTWIPQVDDVWKTSITFETPDPGEAGADVVWDFSDLNTDGFYFQIVFNWIDPAATPYFDSFPDATVCADLQGFGYGYYSHNSNGFEHLGSGSQYGFDVYSNPQTFDFIGLEFEETVQDSYELIRYNNFTSPAMPKGATSYAYDAYGTLILPNVTVSDAIRIFSIDVETDSVVSGGLSTVRLDSLVSYAWIADGSVFPVALWQISTSYSRIYINGEIFSDESEGPDTTFAINPDYAITSAIAYIDLPKLDVFPSVARDALNVRSELGKSMPFTIYTIGGAPVDAGVLSAGVPSLNIAYIQSGYYVLHVEGYAPFVFVKIE